MDFSPVGIRVKVSAGSATRAGFLTWPQATAWLAPGLTPRRRQVIDHAGQALAGYRALGAASMPGAGDQAHEAAIGELTRIINAAVDEVVGAALHAHEPGADGHYPDTDAAALNRAGELLAALPGSAPSDTAAGAGAVAESASSTHPSPHGEAADARPDLARACAPARDAELDGGFEQMIDALTEHARPAPGSASAEPRGPAFADIRAAFAGLREALGLPAENFRPPAPAAPVPARSDGDSILRMAGALAEAHACADWYSGAPEWQRISKVTGAARALMTTIREAAGDYWAEARRDIRVRGFIRTVTARVARTLSGAAETLARNLDRNGRGHTQAWRAAQHLHRAAADCAARRAPRSSSPSPARPASASRSG